MTTTARTANLVIDFQRVKFDKLMRSYPAAQAEYLTGIAIGIFSEASRFTTAAATVVDGVPYVPDAEWAQIQAAMNQMYKVAKETPANKVPYINVLGIVGLMPVGYRGQTQGFIQPIQPATPPVLPPVTTGGTNTPDVAVGSQAASAINAAMTEASTPPVTEESGVITLPTPPANPETNVVTAPSMFPANITPNMKIAGYVGAGLLGAFLVYQIAK